MLGHGPLGSAPLGGLPLARFDTEQPVRPGESPIIQVASLFERTLIERLHQAPGDLRTMDRRRFEELIAELWRGFGYDVELTMQTRDGGKDVVAIRRREIEARFLIECKRPDPGNPVTVGTVRQLLGVKHAERATKAILATTTRLTSDAQVFVEDNRWELEARDFDGIVDWINLYLTEN